MVDSILKIAQANEFGFTIEIPSLNFVKQGIVVSYKETQNSFDKEGLEKCIEHAQNHDNIIGGWFNDENEKFYFDSCKVFSDLEKAKKFGRENEQIAIFDLTNLRAIEL